MKLKEKLKHSFRNWIIGHGWTAKLLVVTTTLLIAVSLVFAMYMWNPGQECFELDIGAEVCRSPLRIDGAHTKFSFDVLDDARDKCQDWCKHNTTNYCEKVFTIDFNQNRNVDDYETKMRCWNDPIAVDCGERC